MNIDKAIEHAERILKKNREDYKNCPPHLLEFEDSEHCYTAERCAEEMEQLIMWLKQVKVIQQWGDFADVSQLYTAYELRKAQLIALNEVYLRKWAECEEYRTIGTIEEFKALKEDSRFLEFLYNHILPNEMEQYLSMYKSSDIKTNGE